MAGHVRLPAGLALDVGGLRTAQSQYADEVLRLGTQAVADREAALQHLPTFKAEYARLRAMGAAVTSQLAQAQAASSQRATDAQQRARRSILAAVALALVGLAGAGASLLARWRRVSSSLRRERHAADTLQRTLLPAALPEWPGIRLGARIVPGDATADVGGDWYDAITLPDGGLALVIGDVVGHDLAAASATGQLRSAMRALSLSDPDPGVLFDQLDSLACGFHDEYIATCLYLRLPPPAPAASGPLTLRMVNAGHCAPVLVSPRGDVRLLHGESASPPLGASFEVRHVEYAYEIEPGSTLLLYTDGLVERRGAGIDAGLARLVRAAGRAATRPSDPDYFCQRVLDEMCAQEPVEDDVTLVALHVLPGLVEDVRHLVLPSPRRASPVS
jgi:serine phosphatase RsbU (regulator of sigma subunit)